ncbi:hypothetical protein M3Y99_00186300 [Aphelenchoides fujianensis]|nr:hypothetical protein M3Y99_00186300 [Aphelenchoides fujianensis]
MSSPSGPLSPLGAPKVERILRLRVQIRARTPPSQQVRELPLSPDKCELRAPLSAEDLEEADRQQSESSAFSDWTTGSGVPKEDGNKTSENEMLMRADDFLKEMAAKYGDLGVPSAASICSNTRCADCLGVASVRTAASKDTYTKLCTCNCSTVCGFHALSPVRSASAASDLSVNSRIRVLGDEQAAVNVHYDWAKDEDADAASWIGDPADPPPLYVDARLPNWKLRRFDPDGQFDERTNSTQNDDPFGATSRSASSASDAPSDSRSGTPLRIQEY